MTVHTVNPGHRVGHPDRGHWLPPPASSAPVFVGGDFAAPGPELLRRVLEGLRHLDQTP
jgi:hypothetical protein